jgi:iron-sulfur cluster assembly protein
MLVLTEAAAEVVKSVTATTQAPAEAGLRIASRSPEPESPAALEVTATTGPKADDQVIEAAGGARVYLEPNAATYLDDKVLDARVDEEGNAHFSLIMQASDGA